MADSVEAQTEAKNDPYQLAAPLMQQVEIRNVLLDRCSGERSPSLELDQRAFKIQTGVSELGFGKDVESKRLFVRTTFTLTVIQDAAGEPKSVLSLTASFVLTYTVASFEGIEDENIRGFSAVNGVYNAWPYWREFAQTTTARMGVGKGITVPVFRIGDNPLYEESSSREPSEA